MAEWLIYGANGYTGELIARAAVARGQRPILAGRSRERVEPLAAELGLDFRVFGMDAIDLSDVDTVLHCAGPFSATAAPMIEACLAGGAHYLDITGEIAVFEHAHEQHERAVAAGVVVCPGVGFDVIPTDCVAAALKAALPDATRLRLGFDTRSSMSPGTTKTSVESLGSGGKVRRAGKIVTVPMGSLRREIDFGAGVKSAVAIPWGDVATAYYSTGIPDIEVYLATSSGQRRGMSLLNVAGPLLRSGVVQRFMKSRVTKTVSGPSAETRAKTPSYVWGEASNDAGQVRVARVRTANGYDLTVDGSLAAVEAVRGSSASGYRTPSQLLGADAVTKLPGSTEITIA